MDAKIDHASAARQLWIVEPGLVGTIGIVKGELYRINVPEFAAAHQAADPAHRFREAIRQVYRKQPVGRASCRDDVAHFLARAPKRLLAEHRLAAPERADGLFRVQRS